jgi:hypothetical protein
LLVSLPAYNDALRFGVLQGYSATHIGPLVAVALLGSNVQN